MPQRVSCATWLQVVEAALDGELCVVNKASANAPMRKLVRHPNFRLLATMNPNTGVIADGLVLHSQCKGYNAPRPSALRYKPVAACSMSCICMAL